MTSEELADSLIAEIVAEERAKLAGPACEDGKHVVVHDLDKNWSRCEACWRTVNRTDATFPWKAYCGSGCECRECQARWSKPTDATPRFDMTTVSKGSLITMDPDHHLGSNGRMGDGSTQGRWRVNGFWRPIVRGTDDVFGPTVRHEGQTLVKCGPTESLYVSLYCICGAMIRTDDFRAHATVTGHIDDRKV
jgi:hypothetical protein